MLIKVLLQMLSYKDGTKLIDIIPPEFIDDDKYRLERLIVKILCSKFHSRIPNILKSDYKEFACLQRYVGKL